MLGGTVAVLDDLAPGRRGVGRRGRDPGQFGQPLSDKVVGPLFFGIRPVHGRHDGHSISATRSSTSSPTTRTSGSTGQLATDGAVILAWGSGSLLPVEIAGQTPRATGNVLYYLPADITVSGKTTFRGDLLRSTHDRRRRAVLRQGPGDHQLRDGQRDPRLPAHRVRRDIHADRARVGHELRRRHADHGARQDARAPAVDPGALRGPAHARLRAAGLDGMPEVELFDLAKGDWVRLPHLADGDRYTVADPTRYVDPTTGTVLVRFVNDRSDGVGFSFDLSIDRDRPMTAIVRTEGLVKRYDGTLAVAGMDLSVDAGEIFGLVGPNGAGKTTTLRILATLLRPSAGEAEVAGWSVTRNPDGCGASSASCPTSSGSTTT